MANTVTFSVGGSGGGGVIKSIQYIVFRVDDYQVIDGFGTGTSSVSMQKFYQISVNLDHAVNPDKTIVIYPQNIYIPGGVQPSSGAWVALIENVIILSKITENSIKFVNEGGIDMCELPDQIIQVIEFE